jgi:site-specific DNA-methyltransferase (adenine-specific)
MPDHSLPTNEFVEGDCLEVLEDFPSDSVHAVVCDPPYGLNFMPGVTNGWDNYSPKEYQEFCESWARECRRVLKPGGHMLAFSGTRTFHRLFTGVEDAGFTVRDSLLAWLHGQGFPKGTDFGRYADELAGQNSSLKPAHEPICLARAPLSESAIYRNVLEHGTGGLNIDETRIEHASETDLAESEAKNPGRDSDEKVDSGVYFERTGQQSVDSSGRYPANVVLDTEAARLLDEQSGDLDAGKFPTEYSAATNEIYGSYSNQSRDERIETGTGGASRFYYTSKASTTERTHNGTVENNHPTVKPIDLCQWLVRLVSKESWTVLDPFCGSGTTPLACELEGREWIAIDADSDTLDLARERMDHIEDLPDEYLNESLCSPR